LATARLKEAAIHVSRRGWQCGEVLWRQGRGWAVWAGFGPQRAWGGISGTRPLILSAGFYWQDPQHEVVWGGCPELGGGGLFSDEVGRPMVVIQPATSSGNVASGENRASTSVVADDDGVFRCCFLGEGIVYVAIVVRLGLLWGKP
jgi:hypothetical protein